MCEKVSAGPGLFVFGLVCSGCLTLVNTDFKQLETGPGPGQMRLTWLIETDHTTRGLEADTVDAIDAIDQPGTDWEGAMLEMIWGKR